MLKEACYHTHPFNFYHFHVCSNNVRGTFKRIQLLCAVGLITTEFQGGGGGVLFYLPDWQAALGDPAGDLEAGDLCPSSRSPCNLM